ncbi:MAG: glycosyltransferase family 4 protein, partial [Candidatus Levybacteria bacterium]|nr:glycosyltransferase family 4 protein [Candidatus Levybacteria bacterium]
SSFLVTGHTNAQMKKEIQRELSENQFDLIHVETSYVIQNIPQTNIPLVLVEHNIEYLVYKRFADNAPLVFRPLLYIDVLKLKLWEERMWRKATKLIAVSQTERKIMEKKRKDVIVVSNGVDIDKFQISNRKSQISKEKKILFIGEFKWMQNRDAIEWILKEIWSKLRAEFIPPMTDKGTKLWIVGKHIPNKIKKLATDKNVIFDEHAPVETELIYQQSDLLLAPIRVGGGTSYKILEAMASGVPVVTTTLGNAINAKENSEILIANNPDRFVQKIIELFENKKLYNEIILNARKLVEEKFSWKKIAEDLNRVYEEMIIGR